MWIINHVAVVYLGKYIKMFKSREHFSNKKILNYINILFISMTDVSQMFIQSLLLQGIWKMIVQIFLNILNLVLFSYK